MDFEFKKSLGQNFLKDNNIIEGIINLVDYKENNLVIEIGPGAGALTKRLLKRVDRAILYEIDTRLKDFLDKELEEFDNYELIFGDFLDRDVKEDLKKYDYDNLYIVANLPYYVTTPIVSKIIEDDIPVKEIKKVAQEPVSLETPIGEEEDSHLGDFIPDDEAPAPAEAAAFTMLKEQLINVLDTLTPREEKVLRLRFGLDDGRARTLEEVGKEFNVTRERIRQIEAKALRKLRHPSRSKKLKDYLD